MIRIVIIVTLLLTFTGCDLLPSDIRIHTPEDVALDLNALQNVFADSSVLQFTLVDVPTKMGAIEAITSQTVDLALIDNSASFEPGVRALLPVFKSVLHLAIRDDWTSGSPAELPAGTRFFVTDQSAAGKHFVHLMLQRAGLDEDQAEFDAQLQPGITDIIVRFGPVIPADTSWLPPGYSLTSLSEEFQDIDSRTDLLREGMSYLAPSMSPTIIPPGTYKLPGNEHTLLTMAVDTLLVTHRDMPVPQAYQITRTLLEEKQRLMAISPEIFSAITEDFDPMDLSFPLHPGARRYLERDEPGLLERYAETINLFVYLAFLIATSLFALARWRARRSRDRIDGFYLQALGIQERIVGESSEKLQAELNALEQAAFGSLINNKLSADESFRIFTDLVSRVRNELSLANRGHLQSKQ
ncbi:MAG: TAXI family TRAP transporter solute-binding subunit [Halioglobus sp.]